MRNLLLLFSRYLLPLVILGTNIIELIPDTSKIYAQNSSDTSTFFCGRTEDSEPATVYHSTRGKMTIIVWGGEYAIDRCEFVSRKFGEFRKKGSLNYLKSGYINGFNVICALQKKDEECTDPQRVLIYLAPEEDPAQIIADLHNISTRVNANGLFLSGELPGDPTTDAPPPLIPPPH